MINKQLNYGRHHIINFAREEAQYHTPHSSLSILDLGAGSGTDLLNIKKAVEDTELVQDVQLFAIENNPKNAEKLKNQGISVSSTDIEHDVFPFADSTFDIVCANQILEHTKELFWITSEVSRILKKATPPPESPKTLSSSRNTRLLSSEIYHTDHEMETVQGESHKNGKNGGIFMVGVPNLASFHNRFLLLLGKQPTSIRPFGPHVRGFTYNGLKEFFEKNNFFTVEDVKGSNFYPFAESIAKPLAKFLPLSSVSIFLKLRRTDKPGCFIDVLRSNFFETNFYVGNGQTLFDWL